MTWITRKVRVDLGEVAERTFEEFLDLLSVRATGGVVLTDIGFRALDIDDDGSIVVEVRGDDKFGHERGWKKKLAPGDEIFWYDPDDGRCSTLAKIESIEGRVFHLRSASGSEIEAWAKEIH